MSPKLERRVWDIKIQYEEGDSHDVRPVYIHARSSIVGYIGAATTRPLLTLSILTRLGSFNRSTKIVIFMTLCRALGKPESTDDLKSLFKTSFKAFAHLLGRRSPFGNERHRVERVRVGVIRSAKQLANPAQSRNPRAAASLTN